MTATDKTYVAERSIGRRKDDKLIRDLNSHYERLFRIGQIITSEIDMDRLFEVIIEQTNQVIGTQRSTVFLHDDKTNRLWSLVATGLKKNQIHIPADSGITGWVFMNKAPVIVNSAYKDPHFNPEIDKATGFKTEKLLCVPLINRNKQCIGVLEALNKLSDDFNTQDITLLTSISHYVTIALENATLYENLKAMDRAKEKLINHLSHELRTPISIISGTFAQISKAVQDQDARRIESALFRGRRNLDRLMDIQGKIDDIMNNAPGRDKGHITRIVESALSIFDEIGDEDHTGPAREILKAATLRIESLFQDSQEEKTEIDLERFLDQLCAETSASMGGRKIELTQKARPGLSLFMPASILRKSCRGILKNAIENTPDEGIVEISAQSTNGEYRIDFKDCGVGITPQSRKMIFGGFFHTQDTEFYSSKRPFQFNAGGAGADLLRIKCFSERFGFFVDFESTRCSHLPSDTDACPGKISECPYINHRSDCFDSGGSTFSLKFPLKNFKNIQTIK